MSNAIAAARAAKAAKTSVEDLTAERKNALLFSIADGIEKNAQNIESANSIDIKNSSAKPASFIDRLKLDGGRIEAIARDIRKIAALPDPVGVIREERVLYNGLRLKKITVPMGVVAVIYEARPNVTADAACLCLKASNAVVLRGGSDALNTNKAIVDVIRGALDEFGVNPDAVRLVDCDRAGIKDLLSDRDDIDLAIPRGSKALIDFVRDNASVPVIETGAGNCSAYLDKTADIESAVKIILNAKTQRISVCNALESLLIRRDAIADSVNILRALHQAGVTVHGDSEICDIFPQAVHATEDDYYREYLSMDISAKIVSGVKEAVECINKYGTHHSDVILSKDKTAIDYFKKHVDSAVVYVNASTRFTDGGQFGLGAEIGISTQKLHARGPMGLDEIVTYKYIVEGEGQIRS